MVQEIRNKYSRNAKVVVGLDLERRPDAINAEQATLQLCINDKCLILQLSYMDQFPTSLKRFFIMGSKFTFVGVEIERDISKIVDKFGLEFRKSEDIRELAMLLIG
ncbi:hypothetical protein K1719_020195 [Acacia pycnantha]|nr:hypothetical protein K1719_020195 [Acacia pycnantha]